MIFYCRTVPTNDSSLVHVFAWAKERIPTFTGPILFQSRCGLGPLGLVVDAFGAVVCPLGSIVGPLDSAMGPFGSVVGSFCRLGWSPMSHGSV